MYTYMILYDYILYLYIGSTWMSMVEYTHTVMVFMMTIYIYHLLLSFHFVWTKLPAPNCSSCYAFIDDKKNEVSHILNKQTHESCQ